MNVAGVRRPIGCLKTAFRRARFQKSATQRSFASQAQPLSKGNNHPVFYHPRQRKQWEKLQKFQLYAPLPSVRKQNPDVMMALREKQIAQLDPTGARTRLFSKQHADSAKVGDILMVTTKTGEPFSGVFIQIRRRGVDTAIQLRGQLMKTGTEMWFKIYSPTTAGIDIIWRRPKRARRARLTYMRKPKHDMGSVEDYVFSWKQERHALRSKTKSSSRPGASGKGTK